MDLAELLLKKRKEKGITQRWLTSKLQKHIPDITEDKLSRKLLGKTEITAFELILLGIYLDIDLNELKSSI